MNSNDMKVLQHILLTLCESENVFKCDIPKMVDDHTILKLQKFMSKDPRLCLFRVHFTRGDDNMQIIRVDDAGTPACTRQTETFLRSTRQLDGWFAEKIPRLGFAGWKPLRSNTMCMASNVDILLRMQFNEGRSYIPPPLLENSLMRSKQSPLPIAFCRAEIEEWLRSTTNTAILYGCEGCGKSTQVVQYILQECHARSQNCRAINVFQEETHLIVTARRVAQERQDRLGNTVGYKLANSFRISDSTNVAFCTDETMIISFLSGSSEQSFAELTHIIVNNVGQRATRTDFCLSLLKEKLHFHPTLKVLLLTESRDVKDFMKLFDKPRLILVSEIMQPDVNINPQSHDKACLYLDQIVSEITMRREILELRKRISQESPLKIMAELQEQYGSVNCNVCIAQRMDTLLEHCWHADDAKEFSDLLFVVKNNKHLVDYRHTETRLSPLMIAAAKGYVDVVRHLLKCGANPYLAGKRGLTALDWCEGADKSLCWQLMVRLCDRCYDLRVEPSEQVRFISQLYHRIQNPYTVDFSLVLEIVQHITVTRRSGKILVTLPTYNDVLECYKLLQESAHFPTKITRFMIYHRLVDEDELILEDNFPACKHFLVILMAGPLIDILPSVDCIDFVIDTGLKVQQVYNPHTEAYFSRTCYNSQRLTNALRKLAKQTCFFLCTRDQFECMPSDEQADRNSSGLPGQMLQALLCRKKSGPSVELFFDSALTLPPDGNVSRSLELLSQIGAINRPIRQPTSMGFLLANLRTEVHHGKALLYSTLFKCLDPMLTIVAALRMGSPFKDPPDEQCRKSIIASKLTLANRCYSDCFVLLRLYQEWSTFKLKQKEHQIVSKYRLKTGVMEAITNTRVEMMSTLRMLGIVKCGRLLNTEELNKHSYSWTRVKACLTAAFYPNLAKANFREKKLTDNCGATFLDPHPLSIVEFEQMPTNWVIYDHKEDFMLGLLEHNTTNSMVHIVENTVITDWMVLLMCHLEEYQSSAGEEKDCVYPVLNTNIPKDEHFVSELLINNKYAFKLSGDCYQAVVWLRYRLGCIFHEFTCNPLPVLGKGECDRLIDHICKILEEEEKIITLSQMHSVGARPKIKKKCPMGEHWNHVSTG